MDSHDWALILYTLILQGSIGLFLVSRLQAWKETERATRQRYLLLVGALGMLAVIASIFHLGSPMNAYLTMSNLRQSWLSREILFTVLFGTGWLISLLVEGREIGSPAGRNLLHLVTGLIGLGAIYVMSMIYRTAVIPAWNHASVTLGFYATAGLIGTAAVFTGELLTAKKEASARGLNGLFVGAMLMLALQVMALAIQLTHMGSVGPEGQASAALLFNTWQPLLWLRVGLTALGATVPMAWVTWRSAQGKSAASLLPIGGLLLLMVTAGELLGRMLFFASKVKIGL